jgi:integrase
MAKRRQGHVHERDGKLYARITYAVGVYVDKKGKVRTKQKSRERRVESIADGWDEIDKMYRELDDHGPESLDSSRKTFNELAALLRKEYLIPPEYINGRKVRGKRSYKDDLGILKVLCEYFGRLPLRDITWGKIERFRVSRLKTPTRLETQRSVARINRELSLLRHALNIAIGERWLRENPFRGPRPLISSADEVKRKRVLEADEEAQLLAVCDGPRAHLKPLIICALDTGMRRGEIFKLKWRDLDLCEEAMNIPDTRAATVQEFNTKTLRERTVPLSKRLVAELKALWEQSDKNWDGLVFGITNNVSNSFATACRLAEIDDLRLHDLRRTFGTRLAKKRVPIHEISRLLGHTDIKTTFIYLGLTESSVGEAAQAIDEWNAENLPQPQPGGDAAGLPIS